MIGRSPSRHKASRARSVDRGGRPRCLGQTERCMEFRRGVDRRPSGRPGSDPRAPESHLDGCRTHHFAASPSPESLKSQPPVRGRHYSAASPSLKRTNEATLTSPRTPAALPAIGQDVTNALVGILDESLGEQAILGEELVDPAIDHLFDHVLRLASCPWPEPSERSVPSRLHPWAYRRGRPRSAFGSCAANVHRDFPGHVRNDVAGQALSRGPPTRRACRRHERSRRPRL